MTQDTKTSEVTPVRFPNLERLANYYKITHDDVKRLTYNSKMIGKKVFSLTFGGWYGIVMDMGYTVDEFIVERPNGRCFPVSIYDVRVLDYNTQESEPAVKSNDNLDIS